MTLPKRPVYRKAWAIKGVGPHVLTLFPGEPRKKLYANTFFREVIVRVEYRILTTKERER